MTDTTRRFFLGAVALGAGGLASNQSFAIGNDGHAAGYDAAPASDFMRTVPRKSGDPVTFTASLDRAAIKATSGGWAREITARSLPVATDMAIAHLFLNPGGLREMHWHNAAEWAYVLAGRCQIVIVDPKGEAEATNPGRATSGTSQRATVTRSRPWAPIRVMPSSPSTTGSIPSTVRSESATG